MTSYLRFFLVLPVLCLVPACGGKLGEVNGNDGGPGNDAGVDAPADAPLGFDVFVPPPSDGGVCNTIGQFGAPVIMQAVAQDFPGPTSPPPPGLGTYALESATYYSGVGGTSGPTKTQIQVTVSIVGPNQWQVVTTSESGEEHKSYALNLATPDGPFKLSATCGGTDTALVEFMQINSPGFVLVVREPNQPKHAVVEIFRPLKK